MATPEVKSARNLAYDSLRIARDVRKVAYVRGQRVGVGVPSLATAVEVLAEAVLRLCEEERS